MIWIAIPIPSSRLQEREVQLNCKEGRPITSNAETLEHVDYFLKIGMSDDSELTSFFQLFFTSIFNNIIKIYQNNQQHPHLAIRFNPLTIPGIVIWMVNATLDHQGSYLPVTPKGAYAPMTPKNASPRAAGNSHKKKHVTSCYYTSHDIYNCYALNRRKTPLILCNTCNMTYNICNMTYNNGYIQKSSKLGISPIEISSISTGTGGGAQADLSLPLGARQRVRSEGSVLRPSLARTPRASILDAQRERLRCPALLDHIRIC